MKLVYTLSIIVLMTVILPSKANALMTINECRAVVSDIADVYSVDKKCPFLEGDEYASLTNVKELIHKLCQVEQSVVLKGLTRGKIWQERCVSPETIRVYRKATEIINKWEK